MLRIHFSHRDMANLRMADGLGPVIETAFALHLLAANDDLFRGWRRRVRASLGPRLQEVERLTQRYPDVPDLLRLVRSEPSGSAQGDPFIHRSARATVLDFCHLVVLPQWRFVRGYMYEEREARARTVISGGLDALLRTLHPKVRWTPPVLHLADAPDGDLRLDGRGLLLRPSFFLFEKTHLLDDGDPSVAPALIFSVPVNQTVVTVLRGSLGPEQLALEGLLGHTRAAALQILTESCTTGELAERLGISLPAASKHATVLRSTGLISTARNRNAGLHTLTSLGMAMLSAQGQTEPSPVIRLPNSAAVTTGKSGSTRAS